MAATATDLKQSQDDSSQARPGAMKMAHRSWTWRLPVALVAIVAFVLADAAADLPNFNPDESRWISRAHYLSDLRDPFGPTWADQYMTRGQPPLGSYVMGAGLLLQGRDLETNPPWDFALPWEENIALGHKPVAADLAAGRRTSAALVALTAVAVLLVAQTFVTRAWAIGAGLLYAVHPFTVYVGSIAMADALFGFLVALAALAAAALARRPGWGRAILLGALLGLGGATKLSPLVVAFGLGVAAVVAFVVAALRERRIPPRAARFAMYGVLVGLVAVPTFVAVYPYLWLDPIERTRNLFDFRVEEMAAQASDWPVMAVPSRAEALHRVGANFTERFSLTGAIASLLGGRGAPAPLRFAEFALALIGIALMAGLAAWSGPYSARSLAFAVLAGQSLVTIFAMRSEFDRYHVPIGILGTIATAVALRWLVRVATDLPFGRTAGRAEEPIATAATRLAAPAPMKSEDGP
jgi:hypothetical protein